VRTVGLSIVLVLIAAQARAADTCAEGDAWACLHDGRAAQARQDRSAALEAFTAACGADLLVGCLEAGRLRLAQGDLDGAEPLLRRVQESDSADGYDALADLYDARSDHALAARLRWDGLAIEQPPAEFVGSYQVDLSGATTALREAFVLDLRIHPMAFQSRRLSFGFEGVLGHSQGEFFVTAGLQHFVTNWLILYGGALVGGKTYGPPFDAGVRAGVELAAGFVGHLDIGVGSTLGSPLHLSFGLGLDWMIALVGAAQAL
jgi:hypothetical protein